MTNDKYVLAHVNCLTCKQSMGQWQITQEHLQSMERKCVDCKRADYLAEQIAHCMAIVLRNLRAEG